MKRSISLSFAAAAVVATIAGFAASPASASGGNAPVFYVALGDSLATGAQPAGSGVLSGLNAANGTNRGYVDVLYDATRAQIPNLQLRNFGCGGETTTSLVEGGFPFDFPCGYGHTTSQLDEALAFLRAHSGEIAFVTIDIGGNDVTSLSGGGASCDRGKPAG